MTDGYYACTKFDINCATSICKSCFANEDSGKGGKAKGDKLANCKHEDLEVDEESKGLYCHEGLDLAFATEPRDRSPYWGRSSAHCQLCNGEICDVTQGYAICENA